MEYLSELVKGIFNSLGFVIGIIILIMVFVKKGKTSKHKAKDLIKPFQDYLNERLIKEDYEQLKCLHKIIDDLKFGKISEEINNYEISKIK